MAKHTKGQIMTPGPTNSITDIAGLQVGNAQDDSLKSGVTVLTADKAFVASLHVMGGAPGTRESDLLDPDKSVATVDALVLAGGSAYGLDACSGVVDGLRSQGRGFKLGAATIPLVPGAILFDLLNGGDKDWETNPYRQLGRQAFEAASETFEIGSFGAGTGALTAMLKGGLGTASYVLGDGTTVAALVAVNPVGSATTPSDRHFWGSAFEVGDEFGGAGPDPASGQGRQLDSRKIAAMMGHDADRANTTIAIVATDAPLSKSQCKRVATAAHDGIGRAIVPAHCPSDGDLVFALSTATGECDGRALTEIGHAASLCLTRAIGRAVYHATPAKGDLLPCWSTLNGG